jgi:hypothetical protein
MPAWQLAHLNIAQMRAPMDTPAMADFVANLDPIHALADSAPGFVWRFKDEDIDATLPRPFEQDMLVNISVWADVETLSDYAFQSGHVEIMKRSREWFVRSTDVTTVLWWVPAGHKPSEHEALQKLQVLRTLGPTNEAFGFRNVFAPPA